MNPVVIDFTERGLEEIIQKYVKLGIITDDQAADFKKSNDEYRTRQVLVEKLFSTTTKTNKSVEDLAKATEKAQKTIINGATNKAIEETGKKVDEVTAKVTRQTTIFQKLRKEYNDLVKAANDAAIAGNKAFSDELLRKAGAIEDKIGDLRQQTKAYASDTATFDAIAQGVSTIGAGFQAAQGAQALFGAGNEDLNKTLVRLQATMALVNGLQQISANLQKESALRTGINNAQLFIRNSLEKAGITFQTQENAAEATGEVIKKRVVVVQAVENALTSKSAIVRGLATAAQWALNNAMYAFPLIAIAAGLVGLIALFGGFSDSLNDTAEKQIVLNETQKQFVELLKIQDEFVNKLSADRTKAIEQEITLLKAQEASTEDIRAKEDQLQKERNRNAAYQAGFHQVEIDNLEKNRLALVGLKAALSSYNVEKAKSGDDTFDKQIESIQGQIENVQSLVELGETAKQSAIDETLNRFLLSLEQQKAREKEGLEFQKNIIASKLRFAKEGSEQQLALNLALAKNERDIAIANITASNQSRADLEAAYLEKVRDLNIAFNNRQLQDKLVLVDATLQAVRKGSEAELNLRLDALELQNIIELNNIKLTNSEREALTRNYLTKVNNLIADFAKKQREDQINTQLNINSVKLALSERNSQEEYNARVQALELQKQLELNAIDRNIEGTELGESKRAEIIAKYTRQSLELQRAAVEIVLQAREDENNRLADIYQRRADLEANNVNTSLERRQELELQAFDNKVNLLEKEKNLEAEKYLNGQITFEEYQTELTRIADEQALARLEQQQRYDEIELENIVRKAEKINEVLLQSTEFAKELVNIQLAEQLEAFDKELAANQALFDNKTISEQAFLANKREIDRQIKESKRKAAQDERNLTLFQITLKTAEAAISAFAETNGGYVAKAAAAVLALAFGALEYGIAASKPLPQFAKGTENAPKGWAWVGEKGPELVWMQGGEKVRTHEKSKEMARQTFHNTIRNTYFDKVDRAPIPGNAAKEAMIRFESGKMEIDYDLLSKKLGDRVGEHIGRMPITNFMFDKNGFNASITQGHSTQKFLDSRYSSQ